MIRADCKIKKKKNDFKDQMACLNKINSITDRHTKQTSIKDFFKGTPKNLDGPTASSSMGDLPERSDSHDIIKSKSITVIHNRYVNQKCSSKKCKYCPIIDTTGEITCSATGRTHYSRHKVNCQSSNLIYCLTCNICQKQYVGQTKRHISERLREHFYNIRRARKETKAPPKEKKLLDAVASHFSKKDHTGVNDLQVHIMAFIFLPPDTNKGQVERDETEKLRIHRLGCPAPRGLNIFD